MNHSETISFLLQDWLEELRGKNGRDFVHESLDGIRTEENAAGYLTGKTPDEDTEMLLHKCRRAAQDVITAMLPAGMKVLLGGGTSFHNPDKKEIHLATDYFDDMRISPDEKKNILLGLAVHEAAHGLYTDQETIKRNTVGGNTSLQRLRFDIWNLLEDERIEFIAMENFPGYASCLRAVKRHYFKQAQEDLKIEDDNAGDLTRILRSLTLAVRYPSSLRKEDVEKDAQVLSKIRDIITPYPMQDQQVWDCASQIVDLLARKTGTTDGGNGQGKGNSREDPGGQQNDDGRTGENAAASIADRLKLEKALKDRQTEKILKAMERQLNANGLPESNTACISDSLSAEFINNDPAERTETMGMTTYVVMPEGNKTEYLKARNEIRPYIPAMSRILACKGKTREYSLRGNPSGKLQTSRLAQFASGNRNIFERRGEVTCSKASIALLIDESGSMSGEKLTGARKAAVLIREAINRIDSVTFFCYGFTADNGRLMLKAYDENTGANPWALGETASLGLTPTGPAMAAVTERIRKKTANPCLMLILTDGLPDDDSQVEDAVAILKRKKVHPIAIGIGKKHSKLEALFPESIFLGDLSRLPFNLGNITKKHLNQMMSVKTDD